MDEIFGNPISGYTTEYYTGLIEQGKELSDSTISRYIMSKNYECSEGVKKEIKYNRMKDKNGN
jgi:hypothetical protein